MKSKVYFGIAWRIIFLFALGMIGTYIPDHLRDFFGDVPKVSGIEKVDPAWEWGARHYWYFWMMFCLFILSAINVVIGIANLINKHY